jgi:O-antigen ligase
MRQSWDGPGRGATACENDTMQLGRLRLDIGVTAAALALFIATNGPSIWLTNRIAHVGYDVEAWPYLYPFALVAVVGLVGLARHRFALDRVQLIALTAVAFYMLWALISVTWSVAPSITAIRGLVTAGLAAFGIWFGLGLSPLRQLRAVSTAMACAILVSAWLVHFRPQEGGGYWDGERHIYFRGMFANANSLGPVCVVGVVSFVASGLLAKRWSAALGWSVLTYVGLWLLWRSGSDTAQAAMIIVALGAVAGALIWLARRLGVGSRALVVGSTLVGLVVLFLVVTNFWKLSDVLAGDSTFGGRREIWDAALDVIPGRPWQGFGFWAYIDGPTNVNPVLLANGTAHDSVLEVLLGLGIVGLIPAIATALIAIYQTARSMYRRVDPLSVWRLAILAVVLMENVTESFVLFYSYIWVLLIATSLTTSSASRSPQLVEAEVVSSSSS